MDEETQEQGTSEDTSEGDQYETTPIIERAREERERLEKATEAQRIENDRTEAIMAKRELGGRADAGKSSKKPPELTDEEYAEKARAGEFNKKDGEA